MKRDSRRVNLCFCPTPAEKWDTKFLEKGRRKSSLQPFLMSGSGAKPRLPWLQKSEGSGALILAEFGEVIVGGWCGMLIRLSLQYIAGEPMREFNERMFRGAGLTVLAGFFVAVVTGQNHPVTPLNKWLSFDESAQTPEGGVTSVSYTHLTLPTKRIV